MTIERAAGQRHTEYAESRARDDAAPSRQGYPWPWTGYGDNPEEMPLGGYTALLGAYVVIFAPLLVPGASRSGDRDRPAVSDVLLFGVATHKLGRIVTKDWVTSPLRAPFTEYKGSSGGGEVREQSRGHGIRRAVGDLLTCPWCIAPWIAGALYTLFAINPPAARLLASVFTSVAVSDTLQHAYQRAKESSG